MIGFDPVFALSGLGRGPGPGPLRSLLFSLTARHQTFSLGESFSSRSHRHSHLNECRCFAALINK